MFHLKLFTTIVKNTLPCRFYSSKLDKSSGKELIDALEKLKTQSPPNENFARRMINNFKSSSNLDALLALEEQRSAFPQLIKDFILFPAILDVAVKTKNVPVVYKYFQLSKSVGLISEDLELKTTEILVDAGKYESVLQILGEKPIQSYHIFLKGAALKGNLKDMQKFTEKIEENSFIDIKSFNYVIRGIMNAKIFPPSEAIHQLMQQMKKRNLEPNSETYVELLEGAGNARDRDSIDKIWAQVVEENMLSVPVVRAKIVALKKCGRTNEVAAFIQSLPKELQSPEDFKLDIQNNEKSSELLKVYSDVFDQIQ